MIDCLEHPMELHTWLIYLLCVLVATATPGPAVLYIMTNTTLHGWNKAMFAALGNIFGLLILGLVAVAGLGALLTTSTLIFDLVKYSGAAYLVYLGARLFLQKELVLAAEKGALPPAKSRRRIFVQACGVAISNPKAIVFLTALFPQFLNLDQALAPQFALLLATLMSFSFCALMSYAVLAHKARLWLMTPGRMKRFGRVSGSVFVGFGAMLAFSSKR